MPGMMGEGEICDSLSRQPTLVNGGYLTHIDAKRVHGHCE